LMKIFTECIRNSQTDCKPMLVHHSNPCNRTVVQLQEQIDRLNSILGKNRKQKISKFISENPSQDLVVHQHGDTTPFPPVHFSTSPNYDNTPIMIRREHNQPDNNSPAPLAPHNSNFLRDNNYDVPLTANGPSEPPSIARKIGEVSIDGEEVSQLFTMYAPHSSLTTCLLTYSVSSSITILFFDFWIPHFHQRNTTIIPYFSFGP